MKLLLQTFLKGWGDTPEQTEAISARDLVKAIRKFDPNPKVQYLASVKKIDSLLVTQTQPEDVVVTLGTRNLRDDLVKSVIL